MGEPSTLELVHELPSKPEPAAAFAGAMRTLIGALPVRARRRVDGWVNILTGLGSALTDRAKNTLPTTFVPLDDAVLGDLFNSDSTARKIVAQLPKDALRRGFRVNVPDAAGGHAVATEIQDAADDLKIVGHVKRAAGWERLFGGCALFIAADDGQTALDSQEQPLRLDTLRKILWLAAIDRTRISPSVDPNDIDMDETSPTYGEPLIYELDVELGGAQVRVHRSRLIIFPGMDCTDQQRRARSGWGISVFDYTYDALQRNATAWGSAAGAMSNAQYVVYKLKGLAQMFSAQNGEARAQQRARTMEQAKSMINAVLIDSEDTYERESPDFGNMPEMLTLMQYDTSSAADMPATKLWGRSPAGMNATGEGDDDNWTTECESYLEHHIRPRLDELVTLLMRSKEGPTKGALPDGWRIYFPPLKRVSDTDKAEIRLKTSQADQLDIVNGVLLPQEVAVSRFRPEGYSTETQIDLATRERLLKLEVEVREKELEDAKTAPTQRELVDNASDDDVPASERQAAE